MWQRIGSTGQRLRLAEAADGSGDERVRRAYYRVAGWLPLRIQRLAPDAVEAAIFDLSLPDALAVPLPESETETSPLLARLRRIEEKLDLLLGGVALETLRPLSGRDRRQVVFSGAGLAVDVDLDFRKGESFRVEMLLPMPYNRVVRAIGEAVEDSAESPRSERNGASGSDGASCRRRLALAFRHIEPAERDALVGYSYDLQRLELRAKHVGSAAP